MKSDGHNPRSRGPYRGDFVDAISEIEAKRRQLGITVGALAAQAGMTERTLNRLRRSRRAFRRQIVALKMAIREIQKQRRRRGELFGAEA